MRLEVAEGFIIESVDEPGGLLLPVPGTVGPQGVQGPAATVAVGTVTTTAPGSSATVTNAGTSTDAIFNFGIPRGDIGDTGPQGIQGEAASVAVGSVTTGSPGSSASVTNSGTSGDAVLDFTLPRGDTGAKGDKGDAGTAATVTVGTVSTGIAGSSAQVSNSGTSLDAVLDFTIPRGNVGEKGDKGDKGDTGATGSQGEIGPAGPANILSIGTVSGGLLADASISGTSPSQVLNLTLPKGEKGDKGDKGDTGDTGPVGATNSLSIGTVIGGTTADATITGTAPTQVLNLTLPKGEKGDKGDTGSGGSWNELTDKPSTFPPSAHSHPISDVTGLSADLAGRESVANKGVALGYASLDSNGKVPGSQLPNSIMTYEGLHSVADNSPALTDASGEAGQVYRVSVGGTRNYGSGNLTLNVGDYLIHSGSVWQVADTTDAVSSVNGYTGNITLSKSDFGLSNVDNTADSTKNVLSASKLTTPRNINGVAFDGTASITVEDSTKEPAVSAGTSAQYYRGDKTWATLNAAAVVNAESTVNKGSAGGYAGLDSNSKVPAANLPTFTKSDVGLGNVDNTADASKNVLSASKLTTPRTINGVSFDGTANITLPAGINRSVQTITAPTTLGSAANTDYVYFLSSVAGSGDQFLSNVVTLLNGNGANNSTSITDAGPLNKTVTVGGSARISTTQSKFGGASLFFPGAAADRLTLAASSDYVMGSGDFCIEGWVYRQSGSGGYARAIHFGPTWGSNDSWGIIPGHADYANKIVFASFKLGFTLKSAAAIVNDTWYHVAGVRSGNVFTLYVNGVAQESATVSGTIESSSTNYVSIGGAPSQISGENFAGYIDDVRITKNARYAANFTAPTEQLPNTYTAPTFGTPTLPTAVSNTNQYTLKNITNSPISALPSSSQKIESAISLTVAPAATAGLISDGTNWRIIKSHGTVTPAIPTFVASNSGSATGSTNSVTVSFTVSGTGNAIVVFVNAALFVNNGSFTVGSATVNGTAMNTLQSRFMSFTNQTYAYMFGLIGSFSGTNTVSITLNGANQGCSAAAAGAIYNYISSFGTPTTGTSFTLTGGEHYVVGAGAWGASPVITGGTTLHTANPDGNAYMRFARAESGSQPFSVSTGTMVGIPLL